MTQPLMLQLGPELRLPALDAQTQTYVVFGGKGMGKTNVTAVFAEELAKNGLRFSWLDPVGVAWGLKHSADGRGAGIPVLILGGLHGDLAILPSAGEVVADFVVDEDVSVIIDISRHANGRMWTANEKIEFVTAYCTRLFERQGERRRPIMQLIDECGRFAPQTIPSGRKDLAACKDAIEQIAELGRNVGIGLWLTTQRSARIDKSVSELADVMLGFRTIGPRSIGAIIDWFGDHIPKAREHELIEAIRELARGTALVVSPGWLKLEGRYQMRPRETFDSSDTPTAGQERAPTGRGARLPDLDKYRSLMAETIEQAEATDPDKLGKKLVAQKATIERLERDIAELRKLGNIAAEVEVPVEVEVIVERIPDSVRDALLELCQHTAAAEVRRRDEAEGAHQALSSLVDRVDAVNAAPSRQSGATRAIPARPAQVRPGRADTRLPSRTSAPARVSTGPGDDSLPEGERKVLGVVAQYPDGLTREHVSVLTTYRRSTRDKYLQLLRGRGYVTVDGRGVTATTAGIDALGGEFTPLPTGTALRAHWLGLLPEGERRILAVLVDAYPDGVARDVISEMTDYKRSTRDKYLQLLRTRRLITVDGEPRASDLLFD